MVLKKEPLLKTVVDGLSILRAACESRGKLGLTDLHHLAESFFCPFLNAAYGLNLEVLKTGHPAIDLGDAKARIAFQITSDSSKAKIQDTLDTYSAKKLFSTYPSVKVLIIGTRRDTYSLRLPKGVAFDQARDVLDVHTIGADIKKMETAKVKRLADIVSAEIVNADLSLKSARSSSALEVSLNGEVLKLPDTTCTYAPDAGWHADIVIHNTSGEVMESGDFSISFVFPQRLYIKDEWNLRPPVYKHPVRLGTADVLYELTQFNRLLPGARERYGVPISVDEDDLVEVGETIAIKVLVHTKYGKMEYPVKLSVVTSDDNLAAVQNRAGKTTQANQAAILLLTSFIQSLEGGTKNLPPVSWKRTFSPLDPDCANLSKKEMIRRLFSNTGHDRLVLYLGAVKGMYARQMIRRDVETRFAAVCQAFGVRFDELV
jgi:hypothetical protein